MDPDHDPRSQPGQDEHANEPMSPEVRGVLRRRLLTGGAAALPVIVTFGRRSLAQTGFEFSNCFSRATGLPRPEEPVAGMRADLNADFGGTLEPLMMQHPDTGEMILVENAPKAGDVSEALDQMMTSAASGITLTLEPKGVTDPDTGKPVFVWVTRGMGADQAGCMASAGITVVPDFDV